MSWVIIENPIHFEQRSKIFHEKIVHSNYMTTPQLYQVPLPLSIGQSVLRTHKALPPIPKKLPPLPSTRFSRASPSWRKA